jgi:hypothetical protein
MRPLTATSLPRDIPKSGIYLFSENDNHLYVGRSNRLRQRLQEHCRPSANHNTAPFAFRLAREVTGCVKASYTEEGSRNDLENDPDFRTAFINAKKRVSEMNVRVVDEQEPLRQALLEMYVSICLSTPHNDFDNH